MAYSKAKQNAIYSIILRNKSILQLLAEYVRREADLKEFFSFSQSHFFQCMYFKTMWLTPILILLSKTVNEKVISLLKNNSIKRMLHNGGSNIEITCDDKFKVL